MAGTESPAVELVSSWGVGPKTWLPGAGMLDEKYEPKPAYTGLKELVRGKLWTNLKGVTGADGVAAGRAFCGEVEVVVRVKGKERKERVEVGVEGVTKKVVVE